MGHDYNQNILKQKKVVHDLNNLFTSNLALIEKLKSQLKDEKTVSNFLSALNSNTLQAIDILESLSGENHKTKNVIPIVDLLKDVSSAFMATLSDKISFKSVFDRDLDNEKISCFYSDLHRVMLNILINARESIVANGRITLSAQLLSIEKKINISISDSGMGISESNISKIFEEGFSTKDKENDSGFGLYIVREVIKNHGGEIFVTSKINEGTQFDIFLPLYESKKNSVNGKKILLVDDDQTILELLTDLLTSYNYKVISVPNGTLALEEFSKRRDFDLIIIDKIMKDMDGLIVIELIRNINKTMPIILTTGSCETLDGDLTRLNITKIIKKPFNFDLLLEEIKELLS